MWSRRNSTNDKSVEPLWELLSHQHKTQDQSKISASNGLFLSGELSLRSEVSTVNWTPNRLKAAAFVFQHLYSSAYTAGCYFGNIANLVGFTAWGLQFGKHRAGGVSLEISLLTWVLPGYSLQKRKIDDRTRSIFGAI